MNAEQAAVRAERVELALGKPASREQRRVECQGRMALGQHEAVTLRIVRTGNVQDGAVQRGDDLGNGQRRADVPHMRSVRLLEDDPPQTPRVNSHCRLRLRCHSCQSRSCATRSAWSPSRAASPDGRPRTRK